jgi:hypothetical protein
MANPRLSFLFKFLIIKIYIFSSILFFFLNHLPSHLPIATHSCGKRRRKKKKKAQESGDFSVW